MQSATNFIAVGRRKSAIARVKLTPGSGKISVNSRTFEEYFPNLNHRIIISKPLELCGLKDKFDISATLTGGGPSGQAGAFRHGISRAILKSDSEMRLTLKKAGFLTRDPRAKERKKYGQKRARKRFQFSKR